MYVINSMSVLVVCDFASMQVLLVHMTRGLSCVHVTLHIAGVPCCI